MDLTQIQHFVTLAKTLNFTRAATICKVAQPVLTRSIQRLEAEMGGPLLLRERSNTQLTELGETILPLLQQSLEAAEAAQVNARKHQARDRQTLRLAFGPGVDPAATIPLIEQVRDRFACVELMVRHGDVGELNTWLLGSKVDVILGSPAGLTDRANRWVVFEDLAVALTPGDASRTIDVAALRTQAIISRFDETARQIEAHFGLSDAVRHRGTTEEDVHALVRAGLGIGLSTAQGTPSPADLVRRVITPAYGVEVCVAALAGRPRSQAADAFIRLARARDWCSDAVRR